ncbi:MAG: HDOD domain-containing protein [Planctomycetota bacterium]
MHELGNDVAVPDELRGALEERIRTGKIELPLLPEVASQVMTSSMDPHCETRKLAELIRRDPALAGHVLRVSNSALFAPAVAIVTLQQAVSRLGMQKIREIALIISCQSKVFVVPGFENRLRVLFKHSLAAGLYAQEIARMRRTNVEEAFLGGLLHDVGRPVLLQELVDLQKQLRIELHADALDVLVEQYHARVGSALIERWALPARLRETVAFHHDPAAAPTCVQAAMTTALADELAHLTVGPQLVDEESVRQHPLRAPLNIYPDMIDQLLAKRESIAAMVEAVA